MSAKMETDRVLFRETGNDAEFQASCQAKRRAKTKTLKWIPLSLWWGCLDAEAFVPGEAPQLLWPLISCLQPSLHRAVQYVTLMLGAWREPKKLKSFARKPQIFLHVKLLSWWCHKIYWLIKWPCSETRQSQIATTLVDMDYLLYTFFQLIYATSYLPFYHLCR